MTLFLCVFCHVCIGWQVVEPLNAAAIDALSFRFASVSIRSTPWRRKLRAMKPCSAGNATFGSAFARAQKSASSHTRTAIVCALKSLRKP